MIDYNLIKLSPNINLKLGSKNKVGILNRGINNKFIDNTFENLDIAILDAGKKYNRHRQ